jgi:F-type H+/Na+-transporting ATPase subunit alpha
VLIQRLRSEDSELMGQIAEGDWDDSIEERLGNSIAEAIDDFGPDFDAEGNPLEEGESDRILSEEERQKEARHPSGDVDGQVVEETEQEAATA